MDSQKQTVIQSVVSGSLLLLLAVFLVALNGCEGPTGDQGPQGPQGKAGPVGPAGEDGSIIYAGKGTPTNKIGKEGDYYLDKNTNNLYGPKTNKGWSQSITLKGNDGMDGKDGKDGSDGKDGEDGKDGKDGKDGSQILKGTASPPADSEGKTGDYYLNTSTFMLYGPKTSGGWGNGYNLKTKVFWYTFNNANDQLDFSQNSLFEAKLADATAKDYVKSHIYLVYLEYADHSIQVPGYGAFGHSQYGVLHTWDANDQNVHVVIRKWEGPGETYENLYIFRIPSNSSGIAGKKASGAAQPLLPPDLDTGDYHAVAKYFGAE